ncbi:hypothetical protein D3C75_995770 [compost metagenome]
MASFSVRLVANTSTRFSLPAVRMTAGFTAGSMPMIGKAYFSRSAFTAMLVAVLQAITSALMPSSTICSTAAKIWPCTSSLGFSP